MRILRRPAGLSDRPTVLTIGNFDGVHLGHQALLRQLVASARALSLPSVVMTFEPHPLEYLRPGQAPARLCSLREKLLLLSAQSIDRVFLCRFNQNFATLNAENFITHYLINKIRPRHIIIGDDFRFGAQRAGDLQLLAEAGRQQGFTVETMATQSVNGQRISSSAVRNALKNGNFTDAQQLLGRTYSIAGRVISGRKLARQIGYPTANIRLRHRYPALTGVFAVWVEGLTDHPVGGVANIGTRPTVSQSGRTVLEVHLFDWNADCYGRHLRVHFVHKLRDEQKFPSMAALTAQIACDAEAARAWLSQNSNIL